MKTSSRSTDRHEGSGLVEMLAAAVGLERQRRVQLPLILALKLHQIEGVHAPLLGSSSHNDVRQQLISLDDCVALHRLQSSIHAAARNCQYLVEAVLYSLQPLELLPVPRTRISILRHAQALQAVAHRVLKPA
jgi:hypothetical protein